MSIFEGEGAVRPVETRNDVEALSGATERQQPVQSDLRGSRSMITAITHYVIPRDEDGRKSADFERLYEYGMRWHWAEEINTDIEEMHRGLRGLNALRTASAISDAQLRCVLAFLGAGIDFYESSPWGGLEPYEGRNADAVKDIRALLAAVTPTQETMKR